MYFVIYFIAGIVIFTFILIKFLEIIFDKKGYKNVVHRFYATLLFLVMVATFINIIISVYSYRKTINMVGKKGDRGIRGKRGEKGSKGTCNEKCGQKVCYVDVVDHANDIFKREVTKMLADDNPTILNTKKSPDEFKINNGFFLDKINSICKSDQYQSIMLGKHPNKPSEKKLIEYLKGIIEEWVTFLVNPENTGGLLEDGGNNILEEINKGIRFLLETQYTEDVLNFEGETNTENPFFELKKYDVWNWGDGLKITPLELNIDVKDLDKPEPDQARIQIVKSNNYKWEYDTSTKKDLWDDTNCDYNQMGEDRTNPQNLTKCIFLNKQNYLKDYVNTWKTDVYNKDQELSLYNADSYLDVETKQQFYPVGSIWRGTEKREKPFYSSRSPPSKNSCGYGHGAEGNRSANNDGPEKETILVSGDVVPPKSMKLLWDSKEGCEDCQKNRVRVYRPEAPDGYVCLGDYAKGANNPLDDEDLEKIRCVPKDCVREKKIGSKVYDNKGVSYEKYDSYSKYVGKTPYESDYQLTATYWSSGVDNIGSAEEQKNLYGLEIEADDGYNLFRLGRGLKKPDEKTYVIKEECLLPGEGDAPKHPTFDVEDFIKNNDTDKRYNAAEYFSKKPPFAVLTNRDDFTDSESGKSALNFEKKRIKIYLEDDLNPRKDKTSDTYFIMTYNPEKNDFSRYIVTNINGKIKFTDKPNKNNKYHRWTIRKDTLSEISDDCQSNSLQDFTFNVFVESYGLMNDNKNKRALIQYYNNMGISHFELDDKTSSDTNSDTNSGNWIYSQMIALDLPRYCK